MYYIIQYSVYRYCIILYVLHSSTTVVYYIIQYSVYRYCIILYVLHSSTTVVYYIIQYSVYRYCIILYVLHSSTTVVLVVSASEPDIIDAFARLYVHQKEAEQSRSSKWLTPHLLYYHILLHDVAEGDRIL